jgi:hypothetical protein
MLAEPVTAAALAGCRSMQPEKVTFLSAPGRAAFADEGGVCVVGEVEGGA